MIHQIAPVKTQTQPLNAINKGLLQARHIQANVKRFSSSQALPTVGELWSPLTPGPYIVPITRWIE